MVNDRDSTPLFQNPLGLDREILRAKSPVEKQIVNITGSLDDLEVEELKHSSTTDAFGNQKLILDMKEIMESDSGEKPLPDSSSKKQK